MRRTSFFLIVVFVLAASFDARAASYRDDRQAIRRIAGSLRTAARHAQSDRPEAAATQLAEIVPRLEELTGRDVDARLQSPLERAVQQFQSIYQRLAAVGVALPPSDLIETGSNNDTAPPPAGFSRDVAAILAAQCASCHGTNRPRGEFSLASYNRLMRGGQSGAPVTAGDPDGSLLIQRLRGESGDRMPLNRAPLPESTINTIAAWIRAGATFDGENPADALERVGQLSNAKSASAGELSQLRQDGAAAKWRLAIPDEPASQTSTERFYVVGNLSDQRLGEFARVAEYQAARVLSFFRQPEEGPLIKGQVVVFAFAQRFDYAEFNTMVEGRDIPAAQRGHWGYDALDAYVAIYPTWADGFSNDALVAQQIAAIWVAERANGRAPRWLTEGAARAVTARLEPRDPRVLGWDDAAQEARVRLVRPDDFQTGKLPPEAEAALAYQFVRELLNKPVRFDRLLQDVGQGQDLDDAFRTSWGATPGELATAWVRAGGWGR